MSLALSLIFFLSGASALLFETLWFRLAGLTFGNSVWASSLVLASFMAGLGLGNLIAGRYGPGWKRPLLVYAGVEVVIGVVGYLLVLGFPALTPFLAPLFGSLLDSPWLLQPLRLGLAFALLLVPSTAMGLTLPLLVKTLAARDGNFGRVLGLLYGCNTLGAVAGALSGELFLIGLLGLRGTGLVAAALNFVAAGCSVALAKRGAKPEGAEGVVDSRALPPLTAPAARMLGAAFLSGALLLGLEVVWFRFLQLFVVGSSLIFAVMLAVVLLGIASGGLVTSVWLGHRPGHYRHAPLVALASAALTAFTYILFDDGFGLYGAHPIKPVPDPKTVFFMTAGLCLPVSLLSGALFTFLGRALGDVLGNETRAAAALTFANTVGAMGGSLLAGFALIPGIGVESSLFWLGAGYGLVGFLSLPAGVRGRGESGAGARTREERAALGLAAAAVALLFVFFPFGLMQNHFIPLTTRLHAMDGSKLVAMREGRTETAIYLRADLWDQPRYHRLVTNGFAMSASTIRAQRYMRLYAYWPAAMHPAPENALLISYGVGITARALTEIGSLESIDVVDISRDILDLSLEVKMFPEAHPLEDPRVDVHVEDGRFFLLTTTKRYDIITAEPPPPKNAGVVNLYSKEYFALLHDRLAPGGIATYWLPAYQLSVDESRAIARAFCDAFADCTLWSGAGTEWMLVGARGELSPVTAESFFEPWSGGPLRDSLVDIGLERPGQLGASFLGDAAFLADWVGDVPALEDNYPHRISSKQLIQTKDYYAAMEEYERIMDVEDARRRFLSSSWVERHWPPKWREATAADFRHQDAINRYFEGRPTTVADLLESLTGSELVTLPLFLLNTTYQETDAIDDAVEAGVVDPRLEFYRAARSMAERDYRRALEHLDAALRLDPASLRLAQYRVLALELAGERDAAEEAVRAIRSPSAEHGGLPGFWEWFDARAAADTDAGAD